MKQTKLRPEPYAIGTRVRSAASGWGTVVRYPEWWRETESVEVAYDVHADYDQPVSSEYIGAIIEAKLPAEPETTGEARREAEPMSDDDYRRMINRSKGSYYS